MCYGTSEGGGDLTSPELIQCLICSTCPLISILVPSIAKENFSHISQGETWGQTFFEERKLFRMKKVTGQTLAKLGSGSMVVMVVWWTCG